jgi:hypothetical protein
VAWHIRLGVVYKHYYAFTRLQSILTPASERTQHASRITHHASRITHHASLRSVNHTLDDEIAVLVLARFRDLERLERVLELERVREERL